MHLIKRDEPFGISGRGHPDHDAAPPMLQRNLLYTGLTRGKRLVVLVGQRKAVAIAARAGAAGRRWSRLLGLLS